MCVRERERKSGMPKNLKQVFQNKIKSQNIESEKKEKIEVMVDFVSRMGIKLE